MILTEYHINAADGLKLYSQNWGTDQTPKAVIALVHGLGEHSGRYRDLAGFLNGEGISVTGMDLRGHGLSEGIRGHAPSYDILMDDIQLFLDMVTRLYPDIPTILMGHSLGGNLVLTYLVKRHPTLLGAIVSAPLLALPNGQNAAKKIAGKVMYNLFPEFTMATGLDSTALSRDINIVKAYQTDPLVHDRVSAKMGIDFLRYGEWLQTQIIPPSLRMLIMQGTSDRIIDPKAVRKFCDNQNGNLTYKEWKGFFHELHNEPQKQDIYREIALWISNLI